MRMYTPQARAPSGICHDTAHTAFAEFVMRREMSDEHGPALGIRGPDILQIFGHSVPDIGWKG